MTSTELATVTPIRAAAPASLPQKMEYARTLAAAGLLPAAFQKQPANVLWAMEYAEALRLPTIAAITGVHVIEGKPTPSAALMSALVRRAGHKLRVAHNPHGGGVAGMAWCEITRADDPTYTFRTEWSVERAADAELCTIKDGRIVHLTRNNKTGNWQKHPIAMMKARALAECARDACEEALMGMHYTAEEMGADVDVDGDPVGPTWSAPAERPKVVVEHTADDRPLAEHYVAPPAEADDGVVEADVVNPGLEVPAASAQPREPLTKRTGNALFALFAEAGLGGKSDEDRAKRLRVCEILADPKEPPTSSNDLSDEEGRVVEELLRAAEDKPAYVAQLLKGEDRTAEYVQAMADETGAEQ